MGRISFVYLDDGSDSLPDNCSAQEARYDRPLSDYPSVPETIINNLRSRLVLSGVRKITPNRLHSTALASTSGYCSRELKRNSKVVYST